MSKWWSVMRPHGPRRESRQRFRRFAGAEPLRMLDTDSQYQRPLLHRILLSFQLRLTQHSSVCMLCAAPKAIGLPGCRQSEVQLITRGNPKKCYVRMVRRSSEKVGVGGSNPPLSALIHTYSLTFASVCSISFQNPIWACRKLDSTWNVSDGFCPASMPLVDA